MARVLRVEGCKGALCVLVLRAGVKRNLKPLSRCVVAMHTQQLHN